MEANEVRTLSQLCEYINEREDYDTEAVTAIIDANGWTDENEVSEWHVCSSDEGRVYLDDECVAQVKYNRGGSRPGAGRPRTGNERVTFYASPAVQDMLKGVKNRTEFINAQLVKANGIE